MDERSIQREAGPRAPMVLYRKSDDEEGVFSPLQILIRQNVELFEVPPLCKQMESSSSRHKKASSRISPGDAGIRCRHCVGKDVPGAVYFPRRFDEVFPLAQNIANSHWIDHCHYISPSLRMELMNLRSAKNAGGLGWKAAWVDSLSSLGVYEGEHALRFRPQKSYRDDDDDDKKETTASPKEDV